MPDKSKRGSIDPREPKPPSDPRLANASSDYIFAATMFAVAGFLPWYFELPLTFDVNATDFNPLIFISGLFAMIGAIMLARTMLGAMRAKKFGNATLSPTSTRRGALFRPIMQTKIDVETTGDYTLVLRCIRTNRSGDDFDGRSSETVLYKQAQTCAAQTRSSIGVSAMFHIPTDVPTTRGPEKGSNSGSIRWVLTVKAPVPGVNFRQDFPITIR